MGEGFAVGRALSLGFSVWFRNFLPFTFLALVIYSPLILYTVSITDVFEGGAESVLARLDELQQYDILNFILGLVLNTLLGATMCYGVVQEVRQQHAGMGATVGNGLRRLVPVLGVWLLIAIVVWAPFVVLVLASPLLAILWIVPALILACMYYVAIPASVMERPGITGALARSRALTAGRKAPIFGLLFLLGLINVGMSWIVKSVLLPDPTSFADVEEFVAAFPTFLYANLAIDIVLATFSGVVAAVSYYLLRAEKEGTSADELAAVFE